MGMDRRDFLRRAAGGGALAALGFAGAGCAPEPLAFDPLTNGTRFPLAPASGRDRWARMPAAFNRRVTNETATTALEVLDGALPSNLAGHVFFQSLSLQPSDAGFSGDGMVWRLDLDGGQPRVTSRLLRTTDYLLAHAAADTPYRFESRGMMRLGWLGLQNQPNTALVAMDGNRLFATVDGGRPWEIDPATLDPITPLGRLDDYRSMLEMPMNRFLCPMMITSAHPPYDRQTGEYYGVSLSIVPVPGMVYLEVLCWDGEGAIKRVPIHTPDMAPVLVSQNAHQIAVSRDHLIIVDAAGTIEYGKMLSSPNSWEAGAASAPRPESHFYVISRHDLRSTDGAAIARKVVIPRETGHFLVDYNSTRDRVVIHVPHTSASDFAEWIQPYDTHPTTDAPVRSELVNAITPVNYDIGVVGRYEIDARNGRVLDRQLFYDDATWGTGGLTARNPNTPDDTVGDVWHANSGFPTDLAVQRVATGFHSHPYRIVPMAELPWEGVPSSLVRIDHDSGRVVDSYFYPGDTFGWTPTFVPRRGTATGSADGHIVAVVYSDAVTERSAGTEFWVFDAADLAAGPVARLGRRDLEVPLAVHSIWLDSTRTSRPDYRIDPGPELLERAQTWHFDPQVESIVRNEVLPAYESIGG